MLYCLTGFLCGVVLLGVAFRNEQIAVILGASGCLAFLLILTSRLNELASLRGDLWARLVRGRQERYAAKITWEAIQRVEICTELVQVRDLLERTGVSLGCESLHLACSRGGVSLLGSEEFGTDEPTLSGSTAIFRLSSGHDTRCVVSIQLSADSPIAEDIAFRFVQRLSMAAAERLERLPAAERGGGSSANAEPLLVLSGSHREFGSVAAHDAEGPLLVKQPIMCSLGNWIRSASVRIFRPMHPQPSLGEK